MKNAQRYRAHAHLSFHSALLACLTAVFPSSAAIHYVNVNGTNPTPPYTTWATAATVIQDAVDAAEAGDEVVVTNGVYETGGRAVYPGMTNRVAVAKQLTVRSVNGPESTVIRGYQVPGTMHGDTAVRGVYLTNGAALIGFTVTGGATPWFGQGGGVFCESTNAFVSNCALSGNSAHAAGGGSFDGTIDNCSIVGNSAHTGGGAYAGVIINSTLGSNVALKRAAITASNVVIFASPSEGAAACSSVLIGCTLSSNTSWYNGGGAAWSTLIRCKLIGNSAQGYYGGGGAYYSVLENCSLIGNSASGTGGGAYSCKLKSCFLTDNTAAAGGAAYGGNGDNCTITGNSATDHAGGIFGIAPCVGPFPDCFPGCTESGCSAEGGTFNNCVIYYNGAPIAPDFNPEAIINYSCTIPLPSNGVGNITAEPELASASHISVVSPCRGAGSSTYVSGVDIDGAPWASPPSIGCDEYQSGADTGPLLVAIRADFTHVAVGFVVTFAAQIEGTLSASRWEFGDGTIVSNRPYTSHAWAVPGDYSVTLRAFNQSFPAGVSATATIRVAAQAVHHVGGATATNPEPPYISWATAAREIQEAIDVALPGDQVLVTNGIYRSGGRVIHGSLTNRIAITKPISVRSVNGPAVTILEGYRMPATNFGPSAVRCAYMTNGAELIGFTLTSGGTLHYDTALYEIDDVGAGVWCESVGASLSDCIVIDNAASRAGGGAYRGTLRNCTLTRNVSENGGGAFVSRLTNCVVITNSALYGGGVIGGTLTSCTLVGNSGGDGGGAWQSTLNNCVLVGNSASVGGGAAASALNNCTITGNRATGSYLGGGGGAYGGTLNNCILYGNTALSPNYSPFTLLNYSCTTPMPTNGVGNITGAPLFVNAAAGNFRLQPNSPCINAGRNAYAASGPDPDGNPRITGGTVDIGAYEFQSPLSTISYAWLQQYGLPTDGSVDFADLDDDGHNNWQEWRAWTIPTNSASVLRLLPLSVSTNGVVLRWQSVSGQTYFLERSTDIGSRLNFVPIVDNLIGQPGLTSFVDTNPSAGPFYRVGIKE